MSAPSVPALHAVRRHVREAAMCAVLVATSLFPCSSYAECSDISYAKMRPPTYPSEAIAAHAQGTALLDVTVGVDGRPQELRIRTSSGNVDLDTAAVESVSTWQFNPRRCDGKAERGIAVVPVRFDLSEALPLKSVGTAIREKPPGAGVSFLSEDSREVAHDEKPMPFQTVAEMLRFLKNDPAIGPGRAYRIDATTMSSMYFRETERDAWEVVESTDGGWTAADGGWTSIIRTRFVQAGQTTWELYSRLCNGSAEWCERISNIYLLRMKDTPPPVPPPASRPDEQPGN